MVGGPFVPRDNRCSERKDYDKQSGPKHSSRGKKREWPFRAGIIARRFAENKLCLADIRQPSLRVALKTPGEKIADRRRRFARQFTETNRGFERIGNPREQPLARQHFPEHNAKRPDVRTLVERLTHGLFRAHVPRRSRNSARMGGCAETGTVSNWRICRLASHARQSEIENLHHTVACDHDVGWFQITMNDAPRVRIFEGHPYLGSILDGNSWGKPAG